MKYTPGNGNPPNYYHNYKQKKQLNPFSTSAFKVMKTNPVQLLTWNSSPLQPSKASHPKNYLTPLKFIP